MARYKLTKPSYLSDRYYPEGSIVEWDGPPNKAMEPLDAEGTQAKTAYDSQRPRAAQRREATDSQANAVPIQGGTDMPDSTWAPQTRPAFSVPHVRDPATMKPGDDKASIVRMAASPPSAASHPSTAAAPAAGQRSDPSVGDRDHNPRAAQLVAQQRAPERGQRGKIAASKVKGA